MQKPDAVQHEHPDFIVDTAPSDQIQSAVKKPDLVSVNFTSGLAFRGHGIIPHLDHPALHNRLVDLFDDLLEPGIILERLEPDMKGLLDALEIRQALWRQRGPDLAEKLIQGFIKNSVFENPEDVPVTIETH